MVDIHADGAAIITAARQQWDTRAIKDYTFALTPFCFCAGMGLPITVQVRNGEEASPAGNLSVNGLFDWSEFAVDDEIGYAVSDFQLTP
ncbi:MAG: hypothetical protein HZT40_13535 [Candidatus Thiothrix singaporensis]|uniref:Uncharacterized protein n=1 Tax=Candidatus Thiothrix singaporensis TaxID=2799669 RepID=A0A7L6AU18_9GAMM|nr:MAG: hypothetical protein HZT40_13535 [Candidatus Thiothrix singaporensis]